MPRPKPNKLHDELDALLDGRPVELTDELAPLAEAADALRAELAAYQLDPKVADRHLERVLHGSATVVPLPVRGQLNGWDLRRRVAAVVLAAALVLAPATMASAAALPGQPMYPFKRAIEELRIASVQWSPSREAVERTRVVDARVDELDRLVELQMFNQLAPALDALKKAVIQAKAAVDDASKDGEVSGDAQDQLAQVVFLSKRVLAKVAIVARSTSLPLTGATRAAINAAVVETQGVLAPPNRDPGSGGATPNPTPGSQAGPANPGSGASTPPPSQPQTQPSGTAPEPPTTTQPQVTTTTVLPTTTTAPEPSTTDSTVTPGSAGGGGDTGAGEKAPADDAAPPEEASGDVPAP
jgi:hypothetical protein